jgi:hypothetical protein
MGRAKATPDRGQAIIAMMRWCWAALLVLLAAVPGQPQDDEGAVFQADARLVVLHTTVIDRSGRRVTNLPRKAFRALEDGVEQQIKVFRREDVPVSMGLIIDNSGSMKNKRLKVERAARDLVAASNPQDEVFVINFNDDVFRDVDFTSDQMLLARGLARIDCRGGTAMRDAIQAGIRYAKAKGKHDKKVIVVVTDGDDNMSGVSLPDVRKKSTTRPSERERRSIQSRTRRVGRCGTQRTWLKSARSRCKWRATSAASTRWATLPRIPSWTAATARFAFSSTGRIIPWRTLALATMRRLT